MSEAGVGLHRLKLTWQSIAWRAAVVVGLPTCAAFADYHGWIKADVRALTYWTVLLAILTIVAIEALRHRSRAAHLFLLPVFALPPTLLRIEADRMQEVARWRIVLMEVCTTAGPTSELATHCRETRVRADYEPCDFGVTAEQCRSELYRDAGWPLPGTPILPHRYGDTLPLGRTSQ